MSFRSGVQAALGGVRPRPAAPVRTVEGSALLGPTNVPAPELASPWVDDSALATIVYGDIYGTLDADVLPLTRAEAMAIPSVARARGVICTTLGRLSLGVYGPGDQLDQVSPAAQLIRQPDPQLSRYLQIVWTADDLIFHGVSWGLVVARYAENPQRPRIIRRILPGGVELHDGGRVTVYKKPVDPRDVVRLDGPHEGILTFAARSIRTAGKLEGAAARFAENPVPAVELHQTTDDYVPPEKRDEIIASWAKARRGANGGVAWTTRNLEAKIHGAPAEHLLTAGRNAQAIDVARHIGVPADAVDASPEKASQNYANRTDRLGVLVDYGLAAYGAAIEARWSMDDITPYGYRVAFDYDDITAVTDTNPSTSPSSSTDPAAQGGTPA